MGTHWKLKHNEEAIRAFLETLAITGAVTVAAQAAKIDIFDMYDLKESDYQFSKKYDLALLTYKESCQAKLIARAVEGYEQDVWYMGEVVGTKRVYSDSLAKAVLDRFAGMPLLQDLRQAEMESDKRALEIAIDGLIYAAEQQENEATN